MIWRRDLSLDALNAMSSGNMLGHLGIIFTRLTGDSLEATLPVDTRTCQPFGLLHGGASVVLAETLGSVAGYLCTEGEQKVVGLEVSASHVRSARQGPVRGVCRPVHLGRSHQVWHIEIYHPDGGLCSTSRLTTAIV